MTASGSTPRSGAALIIAMVILVGLMLLGLPFLFSQSASVASARSLQAAQSARIYDQAAMNLGTALAIYANSEHWRAGGRQLHTALDLYFAENYPPAIGATAPWDPATPAPAPFPTLNHLPIAPAVGGFNPNGGKTQVGIALEDESGKLDANSLGVQGWADLLTAVGIPDWDDDFIDYGVGNPWPIGTGPDGDQCGELANALAYHRLHFGKFTTLDDLLNIDPQTQTAHGTVSGHTEYFRKRMTRAEVELLRPYLSFHNRAPGRAGLIDVGSVIYLDDASQLTPVPTNFVPQQVWLDTKDAPVNDDTWMEVEVAPGDKHGTGLVNRYTRGGTNPDGWTVAYDTHVIGNKPAVGSGLFIQAPPPLNLHQMPQVLRNLPAYRGASSPVDVNVFPLTPVVRYYGQQTVPGTNDLPLPFLTPHYLPDTWAVIPPRFPNTAKRAVTERQPLDIRSGGAITVEHAATIRDVNGVVVAQESRRTIIQAVPQEGVLERRWETQGQLQPLIDQRFGSRMVSWPIATNRATDIQVADVDPATNALPQAETGFSFAPNPTLATRNYATHLKSAWAVNLGSSPTTSALVLQDSQGKDPDPAFTVPPLIQDATTREGLYPDGVRIGQDTRLAYAFDSGNKGPLAWTNANDSSMALRSISVWFKPETDWHASTQLITIMEARPDPSTVLPPTVSPGPGMIFAGVDPSDIPHTTDHTNFFGVLYDPGQNMLVLAYGTPGASFAPVGAPVSLLPSIKADKLSSPLLDERSIGGTDFLLANRMNPAVCKAWSPTFLPNRILTCYKLGNRNDGTANLPEEGRWYHLQVTLANGRPGGLGLILDGIAGSDVGLMSSDAYVAARSGTAQKGPWPGDHLTLPGLVLVDALNAVDRPINDPKTALAVRSLKVAMPGFSAFKTDDYTTTPTPVLAPKDIMPSRGSVLIGDEYIRYQNIKPTGSTSTLEYCTRGDRQNTFTNSDKQPERDPITEKHAVGSRVIPDGCRLQPGGTGNLYRGGATTADDFQSGPEAVANAIIARITAPSIGIGILVDGSTPINVSAEFKKAPPQGFLKLHDTSGQDLFYFYTQNTGTSLILEAPVPVGATTQPQVDAKVPVNTINIGRMSSAFNFNNDSGAATPATVTLISLRVNSFPGDDLTSTADQLFEWPRGGERNQARELDMHYWSMFQIADPVSGSCEWLRYTDIVKKGADFYFLNRAGWTYVKGVPGVVVDRARALCRTGFDPSNPLTYPSGSVITPVQTGINMASAQSGLDMQTKLLSPGDLITLVNKNYSGPSIVAVVRFSATDGYDTFVAPGDPDLDTVNGQFACTAALRGATSNNWSDYEIVMGSGLNTQLDLTPLGSALLPASAPPQLKAHDPGRLVFGGADDVRGGPASPGLMMSIDAPTAAQPFAGTTTFASFLRRVMNSSSCVDRINATGDLPIHIQVNKNDPIFIGPERMGLVEIGGEVFAWRRTTQQDQKEIRDALTALQASFGSSISIPPLSPVGSTVDPEQKAQTDNAWACYATLVGRGQLGSIPREHVVDQSPTVDQLLGTAPLAQSENLDRGQEVMRLPIGPVRTLLDPNDLENNRWFRVSVDGTNAYQVDFHAPAVLVADANGTPPTGAPITEAFQLAAIDTRPSLSQWNGGTQSVWANNNFQKWLTASWLRGLYNTPVQAWSSSATLQPILIGLWTRYPSALPRVSPGGMEGAAQMRSRSFPWLGFPLHLARARFDDSVPFQLQFDQSLTTNQVLIANPTLQVEVRAMAGAVDGDATRDGAVSNSTVKSLGDWLSVAATTMPTAGGLTPITPLFSVWKVAGQPNETEGIEVRLSFRYIAAQSSTLDDIARAGNRAPLISGARLQFHAPVTTLGTEHVR